MIMARSRRVDNDGATFIMVEYCESCLTCNPSSNTDWQPTTMARVNTHNTDLSVGIYLGVLMLRINDSYPVYALNNGINLA